VDTHSAVGLRLTVDSAAQKAVWRPDSSGDKIVNVNFYYDDIVHEFSEIKQYKGHYAVRGH